MPRYTCHAGWGTMQAHATLSCFALKSRRGGVSHIVRRTLNRSTRTNASLYSYSARCTLRSPLCTTDAGPAQHGRPNLLRQSGRADLLATGSVLHRSSWHRTISGERTRRRRGTCKHTWVLKGHRGAVVLNGQAPPHMRRPNGTRSCTRDGGTCAQPTVAALCRALTHVGGTVTGYSSTYLNMRLGPNARLESTVGMATVGPRSQDHPDCVVRAILQQAAHAEAAAAQQCGDARERPKF
jgi:hypothetical protein